MPRGLAVLGPTRRDRSCLEYLAAKPGHGDGKWEFFHEKRGLTTASGELDSW